MLKTDDGYDTRGADKAEFLTRYRQHLRETDRRGETLHWLAEEGGSVIGVMTVRIVLKEPSPRRGASVWGYLTNAYTLPKNRNRGVGARILDAARDWAVDAGLELLIVWPSERSVPLYRRAGFTGRDAPLQLDLSTPPPA